MNSKQPASLGTILSLLLLLPGCASVMSATRDDDRGTLARLLRSGDNPNEVSKSGVTPLFEAVEQNNLPVARMLVEAGADVNKYGRCRERNVTPLHKAAIHGHAALVGFLLDKGADPTAIAEGNNVLTFMALSSDPTDAERATDAISRHIVAKQGNDALVAFLNEQTPSGWTPLAAAAYSGDEALVKALLGRGASVDVLARASNATSSEDEWPPLHFAAIRDHSAVTSLLVAAGARRDQKSRDGRTSSEVVEALEQRRAEAEARRAENEREEAAERAAQFQAFQSGLESGLKAASSPSNPVNDNTVQRRMEEIARPSQSGRSSESAASETPASAATSSPGSTTRGAEPSFGGIIVSANEPAAAPTGAPAPATPPSAPVVTPKYTPAPPAVRNCQDVEVSGPVSGMRLPTRERAEQHMRDAARMRCFGTKGAGYTVSGVSCAEQRQMVIEPVNGKIVRKEDKIFYVCQGQFKCDYPREVCKQTSPTSSGATRQ